MNTSVEPRELAFGDFFCNFWSFVANSSSDEVIIGGRSSWSFVIKDEQRFSAVVTREPFNFPSIDNFYHQMHEYGYHRVTPHSESHIEYSHKDCSMLPSDDISPQIVDVGPEESVSSTAEPETWPEFLMEDLKMAEETSLLIDKEMREMLESLLQEEYKPVTQELVKDSRGEPRL